MNDSLVKYTIHFHKIFRRSLCLLRLVVDLRCMLWIHWCLRTCRYCYGFHTVRFSSYLTLPFHIKIGVGSQGALTGRLAGGSTGEKAKGKGADKKTGGQTNNEIDGGRKEFRRSESRWDGRWAELEAGGRAWQGRKQDRQASGIHEVADLLAWTHGDKSRMCTSRI